MGGGVEGESAADFVRGVFVPVSLFSSSLAASSLSSSSSASSSQESATGRWGFDGADFFFCLDPPFVIVGAVSRERFSREGCRVSVARSVS